MCRCKLTVKCPLTDSLGRWKIVPPSPSPLHPDLWKTLRVRSVSQPDSPWPMDREELLGEADLLLRMAGLDGWERPPILEVARRYGLRVVLCRCAVGVEPHSREDGVITVRHDPASPEGARELAHEVAEWWLRDRWSCDPEGDAEALAGALLTGGSWGRGRAA